MNESSMMHTVDSKFCYPISKNEVLIKFRTDKNDIFESIYINYGFKFGYHEKKYRKLLKMNKLCDTRLYTYYEIKLKLEDTRLAYIFEINYEGNKYYYSEDGITTEYNFNFGFYNYFQVPYINENDILPLIDWTKNAIFYQIFVDRFNVGDENADKSYVNMIWGEKPSARSFAGGDLEGVIKKIPYLKNLGINVLYLTPIFESDSNHKYNIVDYYNVSKQFGDNKILKKLIALAHKSNIKIVLDAVFNHVSEDMSIFQDVIKEGKNSKYFDWFIIDGDYPIKSPLNYQTFSICDYMPKLNTANYEVQKYLIDIATYYAKEFDIDGWRLDVSDEISHIFWRKFREDLKKVNKNLIIIGENWHDANSYLLGDQYDSIMNYSFTKACLDFLVYETLDAKNMAWKLNELLQRNMYQVNHMMLNLLDNHDTYRFINLLNGKVDKMLIAFALLVFYPGMPCIYYGNEILLDGGYDPDNRRCFNWDEMCWPQEFLINFKRILALKKEDELGHTKVLIDYYNDLLHIKRVADNKILNLIINISKDVKMVDYKPIISINYKNSVLSKDGFIIFRSEDI